MNQEPYRYEKGYGSWLEPRHKFNWETLGETIALTSLRSSIKVEQIMLKQEMNAKPLIRTEFYKIPCVIAHLVIIACVDTPIFL